MKSQIKQKWVGALRSGQYKQGTNRLNRNGRQCVLGVLCDLYIKETGSTVWKPGPDECQTIYGERFLLPRQVADWAGTSKFGPRVMIHPTTKFTTVNMFNDAGRTFAEIADLIEKGSTV